MDADDPPSTPQALLTRKSSTLTDLTSRLSGIASEPVRRNADDPAQTIRDLEEKLQMSASIGQALLERHDAYVQQAERTREELMQQTDEKLRERIHSLEQSNDQLVARLSSTVQKNSSLEKRLSASLGATEAAEASVRNLLAELSSLRANNAKLYAQQAKLVGAEERLKVVQRERDDARQEREAESKRAGRAEWRVRGMEERIGQLEDKVASTKRELEDARASTASRAKQSVLEAKARAAASLPLSSANNGSMDTPELFHILETLVADNETLKHDNTELSALLSESQEDLRRVREEHTSLLALPQPQHHSLACEAGLDSSVPSPSAVRRTSLGSGGAGRHWRKDSFAPSLASSAAYGRLQEAEEEAGEPEEETVEEVGSALDEGAMPPVPAVPASSSQSTSPQPQYLLGKRSLRGRGAASIGRASHRNRRSFSMDNKTAPSITRAFSGGSVSSTDVSPHPSPNPDIHRITSPDPSISAPTSPADLFFPPSSTSSSAARPPLNQAFSSPEAQFASWRARRAVSLDLRRPSTAPRFVPSSSKDADAEGEKDGHGRSTSPAKFRRKQLLLLSYSRGTQTSPIRPRSRSLSPSPHDAPPTLSDEVSSSGTPNPSGTPTTADAPTLAARTQALGALIEHMQRLLVRLAQSDVKNLTRRLRRQNLPGDVGHLSRTTFKGLENELAGLRDHFRAVLEQERRAAFALGPSALDSATANSSKSLVTRHDFLALVKLFKEVFLELARAQGLLNDVTLDPSLAQRLKEAAAAPDEDARGRTRERQTSTGPGGWIAPLMRLVSSGASAAAEPGPALRPPLRAAPKLAAATSATSATVNVEFAGGHTHRAVSSTLAPPASSRTPSPGASAAAAARQRQAQAQEVTPRTLRGREKAKREDLLSIFAGAPVGGDKLLMVNERPALRRQNFRRDLPSGGAPATSKRLSTIVDAVTDSLPHAAAGTSELEPSLLERTLRGRPRGLSDSSIHSTFIRDGGTTAPPPRIITPAGLAISAVASESASATTPDLSFAGTTPASDRESVLANLSRKMSAFRVASSGNSSGSGSSVPPRRPGTPGSGHSNDGASSGSKPSSPTRRQMSLPIQRTKSKPVGAGGGFGTGTPVLGSLGAMVSSLVDEAAVSGHLAAHAAGRRGLSRDRSPGWDLR